MLYRFAHKTGSYGVSIKEEDENQVLVQVEQVIKHPKQGDLHHPNETENVFFHERKALSQFEKRYTSCRWWMARTNCQSLWRKRWYALVRSKTYSIWSIDRWRSNIRRYRSY